MGIALDLGVICIKIERDAVDAMPLVGRRVETLPLEDMPQMTSTVLAGDLNPFHAQGAISVTIDRTRNGVEEGGPAAARVELGRGLVEWRVTTCTGVDTVLGIVVAVLACPSHFGPLLSKDSELLWVELGAPLGVRHALRE